MIPLHIRMYILRTRVQYYFIVLVRINLVLDTRVLEYKWLKNLYVCKTRELRIIFTIYIVPGTCTLLYLLVLEYA
jgi:hypothetical protein